jgi:hypothetical protein
MCSEKMVGAVPNDVFRLNLALEPTQGVLDRLTLLQSNFCQNSSPPNQNKSAISELTPFVFALVMIPEPVPATMFAMDSRFTVRFFWLTSADRKP